MVDDRVRQTIDRMGVDGTGQFVTINRVARLLHFEMCSRPSGRLCVDDRNQTVDGRCPACGQTTTTVVQRTTGAAYHRCGQCGHMWQLPADGTAEEEATTPRRRKRDSRE